MKKELIVRAWKDPAFRASLSAEERTALPESPSGHPLTELDESELSAASGGLSQHSASNLCRLSALVPGCSLTLDF